MKEMKCVVCDKSIPRGQRFIGDRYKSEKFCCEDCYNVFCNQKDEQKAKNKQQKQVKEKSDWRIMTDYISEVYPPDTINWMLFTKQIKSLMEKYDLTCNDIKMTIKYAIKYDNYELKPEYGISQFIPRFVEPMRQFKEQILTNKVAAKNMEEPQTVFVKKSLGKRTVHDLEDFDDE